MTSSLQWSLLASNLRILISSCKRSLEPPHRVSIVRLLSRKFLVEAVTMNKKRIEKKMMEVLRLPPLPRSNAVLKRRPRLQRRSSVVGLRQRMRKNVNVPTRRDVNRSRLKKSKSVSVKNTSSRG